MSWDILPKANMEYALSKLKTDVLDYKVDTEAGKGLSSNDFTTTEKNKLAGISANATKVESSETNGNIKIDGTETQVYDDSELQGIVDTDTTTATGNPLNFSTKSAQNAVNTDIVIDPVQDLHGFTKPWVGGAGKNKYKMRNTDYSNVGINLTANSDGTVNFSGTATGGNFMVALFQNTTEITQLFAEGGNFSLSFNKGTYNADTLNISIAYKKPNDESTYFLVPETPAVVPANSVFTASNLYVANGNTVQSLNGFAVQLEKASSVTSFEPYENICPISPKEQITVQGCGKNLFDPDTYETIDLTGESVLRYGHVYGSGNYKVINNNTSTSAFYYRLPTKDLTNRGTSVQISNGSSVMINVDSTHMLWIFTADSHFIDSSGICVIKTENEAETYEPYNLNADLQIPIPNDFYGGTLNLETGELRVENKIVDLGSLAWTYHSGNNCFYSTSLDNYKAIGTHNIKSSGYALSSADEWSYLSNGEIIGNSVNETIYIKNTNYTDAALFKTSLSGIILVYELKDSLKYTLHLTPQQLNLLKATNNISTDAKTISVTYRNGELSTYAPATDIADGLLTATDKRAIDRTSDIVEGNPIQFSTESKQIARNTIIDLEPIQDLHGFTKPWVGGAGKNILSMTIEGIKAANTDGTWSGNDYSLNGVTFTILTDSDNNVIGIKANGTANPTASIYIYPTTASNFNGTILNGCPSGGGSSSYKLQLYDATSSTSYDDTGSGVSISATNGDSIRILIGVINGYNAQNKVFYPMLRKSTDSATFEPYTNICSISGYDEVDINGCGKNLCPTTGFQSSFTVSNANVIQISGCHYKINGSISGAHWIAFILGSEGKIPVDLPKGTYTVTASNPKVRCYIYWDEEFTEYMSGLGSVTSANKPIKGIRFLIGDTTCDNEDIYLKVELGSQATPYVSYQESNNLTIQLDDTVYGGKLDVEKGELVVDKGIYTLTGEENFQYYSSPSRFAVGFTSIGLTNATRDNALMSNYPFSKTIPSSPNFIFSLQSGFLTIINNNYGESDLVAFKASLVGAQLCYELATPTTIQLSPHAVNILKGVNTITTNGTSITLNYRNGEVATLEDLKILSDNLIAHTEDTEPYGFIEHMDILDPAQRIEYIGKNKNYKPVTVNLSGDHLANYNEWYDFFVLKENKPYMIKSDGTVDYALDPNDYTKKFDGSASDVADTTYTGGAFAWIPKIYKYEYVNGSNRYVYLSQKKLNDNYEAVGFIDENGLEHDGVWIPMFYGTEITQSDTVKIMSLATGTPSESRDTDTQKTYIENFSSKAKFFGGPIINVLADLLIMLGKNSDVQAVFGTGNSSGGNGAQYMKANACINGGAFYGSSTNTALNKAFHSLVLLTQNSYQRDPYTILVNGTLKVSPYYKYDITGATYQDTGITYPASSSAWEYPHKSISVPHWGAVPDKGPYSGSTTTGWADGFYKNISSTRVGLRFAACDNGRFGGPRCLFLNGAASGAAWCFGASALLFSEGKSK